MTKKTKQYCFILLMITILLIRLPSIYILPFQSPIVTTHNLVRVIISGLFAIMLATLYKKKGSLPIPTSLAILLTMFFATQSLSVISAVSLSDFFLLYKNLFFSLATFILTLWLIDTKNSTKVYTVLIFTLIGTIAFEWITYFKPRFLYIIGNSIFYNKYWKFLKFNLLRKRYFTDIYDEAFIPLVFIPFFTSSKKIYKLVLLLLITLIVFFALLSNWRIKLIMLFISGIGTFLIYFRHNNRLFQNINPHKVSNILFTLTATVLVILITVGVAAQTRNTTFNRLFYPGKSDLETISGRIALWKESFKIAKSHPFFGVGIGNFNEYLLNAYTPSQLPLPKLLQIKVQSSFYQEIKYIDDPHNIFFATIAETGFSGFFSLVLLLIYFIKYDIEAFRRSQTILNSCIVAYWTLFSYSLLNPGTHFSYLLILWMFRGMITKLNTQLRI